MLDGLLGRGYSAKCKSLIKMTKSRIEVIRRKRNATLKFLKKDMADLLANGLDINAYGRAEGLLAELTMSSSYDYVENYCDFVLKHLSVMQKIRHCPEDCREAASSLMFAAARFSDLPELRDLRDIFLERYGSSVELFANQEFVENLSSKPSTTEKKIQIMQDIASEFCITWDSRGFELRVSKPSASVQDQPTVHGSLHGYDDKYKSINGKDAPPRGKHDVSPKERVEIVIDGYGLHGRKERNEFNPQSIYEVPSNGYNLVDAKEDPLLKARDTHDRFFRGRQEVALEKHESWKEDTPSKRVGLGSSSHRKRMESVDGGSKQRDGGENTVSRRNGPDTLSNGKSDILSSSAGLWSKGDGRDSVAGNCLGGQLNAVNSARDLVAGNHHGGQFNAVNSARDVQEEAHKLNPYYNNAIPPYTKPNAKLKDGKYGGSFGSSYTGSELWSEKILQEAHLPDNERQMVGPSKTNCDGHENDNAHQDVGISNPIPKPRSSRRKHSKSRSTRDDVGHPEDTRAVKRRTRSRRRDDSRRGLQILFDDEHYQNDKEERMIDKLLIHYSMKPSAYEPGKVRRKSRSHQSYDEGVEENCDGAYEPGKVRRKSRSHQSYDEGVEENKLPQQVTRDKPDEISEVLPPPRSISLPREQTAPSEATKVFIRAASFQPDRSSAAKHVHPKLPDYDDLAARFAALKGR